MHRLNSLALALSFAITPVCALGAQGSQDPSAPAQNASQLSNEAATNKAHSERAKNKARLSKNAEKADKKAAKKESKVEKDQKKAADANAAAGTPR